MAASHPSNEPVIRLRLGESQYSLLAHRLLVGRSRSCDVRLKDDTVSRLHAAFSWRGSTLLVEDLGSSNGTYVNGTRLADASEVKPGDVIRFGAVRGVIESPGGPPASAPARTEPLGIDYTIGVVPGAPAELGRRLLAAAADVLLFLGGSLLPLGPLLAVLASERFLLAPNAIAPSLSTRTTIAFGCAALWLLYAWYYVVHGWAKRGGTPGLRLLGLRLVDPSMRTPVGHPRAWLRLLGLATTVVSLGLGFLLVQYRPDRRALHDVIAGTQVVHKARPL